MLELELREILRELVGELGAASAAIVRGQGANVEHARPLGAGSYLVVEPPGRAREGAAAIERAARAIRACARRWQAVVPALASGSPMPRDRRIRDRIDDFLRALAGDQSARNALLTLHGHLVGAAFEPAELELSRVEFMLHRLDHEAGRNRGHSSHVEISGEDFYAVSFWYGAALMAFFDAPYSLDFVRHRARRVTMELAGLLGDLDDPPRDPAKVAPIPEY